MEVYNVWVYIKSGPLFFMDPSVIISPQQSDLTLAIVSTRGPAQVFQFVTREVLDMFVNQFDEALKRGDKVMYFDDSKPKFKMSLSGMGEDDIQNDVGIC